MEAKTIDGRFVVERTGAQSTKAELRNARALSGEEWSSIQLQFGVDSRELLVQGFVPKIYGGTRFAEGQARIRGVVNQNKGAVDTLMTSIVYFEVVEDEAKDPIVTYVFRLDGNGYQQLGVLDSMPSERNESTSQFRFQCEFVYYPTTKQLSIVLPTPGPLIRIPDAVIPSLARRLRLDLGAGPDGPCSAVMRGNGVIDGSVCPQSGESGVVMLFPNVITFDCGIAVHRLWLNRNAFRWYIDEPLAVPIH